MNKKVNHPAKAGLEQDKIYAWCSCGRSEKLPFCDGLHKGTEFKPLIFKAEKSAEYNLCNCGNTRKKPFCDGKHNKL